MKLSNYLVLLINLGYLVSGSMAMPQCNISLIESIPDKLTYESPGFVATPTWETWTTIINKTQKYLKMNTFYWNMKSNDTHPTTNYGRQLFKMIIEKSKTAKIYINQDEKLASTNYRVEIKILQNTPNINVSMIYMDKLIGRGVQHSKVIISDGTRAYIGSANMDWRSLTQIKETGIYIENCPELVQDIEKQWNSLNSMAGKNGKVPKEWPSIYSPKYNFTNPLLASFSGVPMKAFIATSPPDFNSKSRSNDIDAIISTISRATKFIWIEVMDFLPMMLSYSKSINSTYWPNLANEIVRNAFDRGIEVRLLISQWQYSSNDSLVFLKSLSNLSKMSHQKINLKVKVFIVPSFDDFQKHLEYARVSHSKFMVTDNTAYIGTSNWSGDYFQYSVGVSFIAQEINDSPKYKEISVRAQLEKEFLTDWNSIYSHDIDC